MCLQRWMTTPQVNVDEDVPRRLTSWTKDHVSMTDVSEALWSDAPLDKPPAGPES